MIEIQRRHDAAAAEVAKARAALARDLDGDDVAQLEAAIEEQEQAAAAIRTRQLLMAQLARQYGRLGQQLAKQDRAEAEATILAAQAEEDERAERCARLMRELHGELVELRAFEERIQAQTGRTLPLVYFAPVARETVAHWVEVYDAERAARN